MNSVFTYLTAITKVATIKPLTPDKQHIKSMKDSIKQDQADVKAERARQKIKSSQRDFSNSSINPRIY
jgi:hypothetical protein